MNLQPFIASLFEGTSIRVAEAIRRDGSPISPSNKEIDDVLRMLVILEQDYRLELPGTPPALHPQAMIHGALTVYRVSSFLVHRDADPEVARRIISEPWSQPTSPEVCYSVDLTMRFLPDLIRLAKAASASDPIIDDLKRLACEWALSSVGIADLPPANIAPFWENDCLARLYVDRIFAVKDRSRLENASVREAVRAAIGVHGCLAPELSGHLVPDEIQVAADGN